METTRAEVVSREPLPAVAPKHWGRDHWSTLAYLETVGVDRRGEVGNEQMRTNPRRHREFIGKYQARLPAPMGPYPTRLNENAPEGLQDLVDEQGHDDWDCVDDLARAGLLEVHRLTRGRPGHPVADGGVAVALTEDGRRLASELRRRLAEREDNTGSVYDAFRAPDWLTERRERPDGV